MLELTTKSERTLYLMPSDGIREETQYHCKYCPFFTDDKQECIAHVDKNHLDRLPQHEIYDKQTQTDGGKCLD